MLAATNRPEILDPALLRAGRFDRQVLVDRPDRKGRLETLKVHVRKIALHPEVDLDRIAAMTVGFTGADLANLVNEAAVVATRRDSAQVTFEDVTAAIERIVAGLEKKSRILTPPERATEIATEMVTLYGMVETFGQRTYKPASQGFLSRQALDKPVASEATLREIDLSVRDIVADAFDKARAILTRRRADLDKGAELLLTKEAITAEDFPAIRQAETDKRPPVVPTVPA